MSHSLSEYCLVPESQSSWKQYNADAMDFTLSEEELDQITRAADEFELA